MADAVLRDGFRMGRTSSGESMTSRGRSSEMVMDTFLTTSMNIRLPTGKSRVARITRSAYESSLPNVRDISAM